MICTIIAIGMLVPQGPTIRVGDRDVPVTWPDNGPSSKLASRFELDGMTFGFSPNGALRGPEVGDGSNKSYENAFSKVVSTRPDTWRVRVQLATATDILDRGSALRTRRGYLEKGDIDKVYSALAQFAAMASVESGGRYTFTFDIETDTEPQFQERSEGRVPFDASWLREYLWPRINGFDFKADDKVYRGPYDSVFVVHGGLTSRSSQVELHGTLAHAIPYFRAGAWFGQDTLARDLLTAWNADIAFAAGKSGFATPEGWVGKHAFDAGSFGAAAYLRPSAALDRSQFKANFTAKPSMQGIRAKGADFDAIRKLGHLSSNDLRELAGSDVQAHEVNGGIRFGPRSESGKALDSVFHETESAAYVKVDGPRDLLLVRPGCVRVYAEYLPDSSDPRIHGFLIAGRYCFTVLTLNDTEADTEARLLGRTLASSEPATAADPPDVLFDGSLERAAAFGTFAAKAGSDQGVEITSGFGSRLGGLVLFRSDAVTDFSAKPYLKFRWRSSNAEPMVLVVRDAEGSAIASFQFFGMLPAEGEAPAYSEASVYGKLSDEWQETVLRMPPGVLGRTITLESDPRTGVWGGQSPGNPAVTISSLTASKTGPEVAAPLPYVVQPAADSPSAEGRARWAYSADASDPVQQAKLISLLSDRQDWVKMNAAFALGKVKDSKIEAALSSALATLDPRVAEQCVLGLAAQETESAITAVSRQVMSAASEWSKLFVIRTLADRKDVRLAGLLSGVYASRSYQVRAEGARALGMMAGREPALLVSVFLQETSPTVRLMATRFANAELDPICRKVLFSAVNDPLDAVRIASYEKLLESSYEAFRAEGLKGIRDDSIYVRLALLERWRANPEEYLRPAIRLGVADSDPRVRAAALRAMAKLPGPVTGEEIGPAVSDDDPRVVDALAELKRAKGLEN